MSCLNFGLSAGICGTEAGRKGGKRPKHKDGSGEEKGFTEADEATW